MTRNDIFCGSDLKYVLTRAQEVLDARGTFHTYGCGRISHRGYIQYEVLSQQVYTRNRHTHSLAVRNCFARRSF